MTDSGGYLRQRSKWLVISTYSDGDSVLEAVWPTKEQAEDDVPRVEAFRDDQDEAPVVWVEKAA